MNTKTMIAKYQEKGYTVKDLHEHYKIHESMGYKNWVSMMKQIVEEIQVKTW